jgi:imidazolonepropionase-like amidohydrolase
MDLINFDKLDPRKRAKAEYVDPLADKSLVAAIEAGVKVAIGTDAPLIPHGMNAYEIVKMTERGMSPLEAIQAATIVASELARIEELGELREGWHADIIGVDTNPLEDISSLQSVDFVMKAGNIFKNED